MTNFNTNPSPRGNHARPAELIADSVPAFDIDRSVAASVAEAVPGAQSKRSRTFLTGFAGAAMACMLALGINGAVINPATAEAANEPAPMSQAALTPQNGETLAEAVAAKCLPSVVFVETYADAGSQLQAMGTGSGVVMTQDGYLITNNHVVDGGQAFKVTIEGNTYDAELVGADSSSDVAVLKAKDANGLTPMEIGNSDDLTVGQWVMTLGAPFGLEQSVATGIVSATSRSQIMDASTSAQAGGSGEVTIYPNMIQTDAAINPGNSGGALLNMKGEVIGINAAKYSSTDVEGVGYAIPISKVQDIIGSLMTKRTRGDVVEEGKEGYLGIQGFTVEDSMVKQLGMPSGIFVSGIIEGGAASRTDLKEKDVITKFDDQTVRTMASLQELLRYYKEGETVTMTVQSLVDGAYVERTVEITLGGKDTLTNTPNQQPVTP